MNNLKVKRLICHLLTFAILCFALTACTKPQAEKTLEQLFAETKNSVAAISVQSMNGSAFAVKKTDDALYVVTNCHTFPSNDGTLFADTFSLTFFGGETASTEKGDAKLIGYNIYHDIAVIRVDKSSDAYAVEPLKTGDSKNTAVGSRLYAIGNSNNYGLALFTGALSATPQSLHIDSGNRTVPVMQITVPINAGSSGCPVLNYAGEAVGIGAYRLTGTLNDPLTGMYFCIPVNLALVYIDTIISENGSGESKAAHCETANVRLDGALKKFEADYGIYGFKGALNKEYIEITELTLDIEKLALSSELLRIGDKITKFGDLSINGADIFDIIINSEKFRFYASSPLNTQRLVLTVMRDGEVFQFSYKSMFKIIA